MKIELNTSDVNVFFTEESELKVIQYSYKELKEKNNLSEREHAERAKLRCELRNIPKGLSREAVEKFHDIEGSGL